MFNNSGTYGPNEVPNDMVAPFHKSQSCPVNFCHSLNQPPLNLPPQLLPFQAYQSMGHLSTYIPPNLSMAHENATKVYYPAVSNSVPQEHHNNMLNFHQNIELDTSDVVQDLSDKETSVMKNFPLNIPQIPTRIFQTSLMREAQSLPSTLSASLPPDPLSTLQNICSTEKINSDGSINLTVNSKTSPYNTHEASPNNTREVSPSIEEKYVDVPENLSQNSLNTSESTSNTSPSSSTTDKNKVNTICSSLNPTDHIQMSPLRSYLSDRKRKSLEKTVRLIESILIKSTNNNTKSDIREVNITNVDPLALSPKPISSDQNTNDSLTDSDDEALITKVTKPNSRNTRSPSKKIQSTRRSHVIEYETKVQIKRRLQSESPEEVVVKVEDASSPEREMVNPFLQDCNGIPRSDIADIDIVKMENSVEEASKIVKNGIKSSTYFECPYCSLLLHHPKRFLIHTKWHSFGLINEKRATMARERENTIRERRLARSNQRLLETEALLSTGEKQFPCKDCDKVFPKKSSLKGHRRKFHITQAVSCKICLEKLYGMQALRTHMATHEDKAAGGHQCPKCTKRFKYRHSLAKHIGTHLEKTHACPECGKMFGSTQLVKLHMKTHERAARGTTHHCSYCGKGFYEPYNLNVHERTHRNDRPFKCDTCGSTFITNSSLKRHIKVSHRATCAKPHICDTCQKCFSTASIRDRHHLRAHADTQLFPYPCTHCTKRYMKPKDLRSHMYKSHPKEKKMALIEDEQMSS